MGAWPAGSKGWSEWVVHQVMRPGSGSMMNDGNNTANSGATLKINWRPEVKHRASSACPSNLRTGDRGTRGITQFGDRWFLRVILNSLSCAYGVCGASWYRRLGNSTTCGSLSCAGDGADSREEPTMAKGKRTYQPNNRRRAKVHGFRLRMRTRAGRGIVAARRRKGRSSLTA